MQVKKSLQASYSLLRMGSVRNFKAAVVLSGCGVYDGSEITEAVSMLIALSDDGAKY